MEEKYTTWKDMREPLPYENDGKKGQKPGGEQALANDKKAEYLGALDKELASLVESGRISPEEAKGKRERAEQIKTGFSDDLAHDALMFATAGVVSEKERIEIINKGRKGKSDFKGVNPSDFRTPYDWEEKSDDSEAEPHNEKQKEEFLKALDKELVSMVRSGKISLEEAEGKRKRAELIETGLSDDPEEKAISFAREGIEGAEDDPKTKDLNSEKSEKIKALREKIDKISKELEGLIKELEKIQSGETTSEEDEEKEDEEDEKADIYETPAYKEVIAEREKYLKAMAKKRKWFRRGAKNGTEELREKYIDSLNKFVAERVAAMKGEGLSEEEISREVSKLVVGETYDRTNREVELANDKKSRRVLNWFKQHPKLRMVIGGALTVGAVAAGATGAFPLSVAFLGARAAVGGVGTAIAAEGGLDWLGEKYSRKRGAMSGNSKEDIDALRHKEMTSWNLNPTDKMSYEEWVKTMARAEDMVAATLSQSLDKKLAAHLAHSVRKGKMFEKEDIVDISVEKRNQFERDMVSMMAKGISVDGARANLVEASVRTELLAVENAQDRERTRSIQRWAAAGALGVISAGVFFGRGLGNIRAQEAAMSGKSSLADHPKAAASVPKEAAHVPSLQEKVSNYSVTEVAKPGDGNWMLAERGLDSFKDQFGFHDLTKTQDIIATDYIKDVLGEQGLQIGETKRIPGTLINEAYNYAKAH
ncbi:MAG: hypothetical protein Q7S53_01410 [bacterium]|nr:hypothetical protein [bacterium]